MLYEKYRFSISYNIFRRFMKCIIKIKLNKIKLNNFKNKSNFKIKVNLIHILHAHTHMRIYAHIFIQYFFIKIVFTFSISCKHFII